MAVAGLAVFSALLTGCGTEGGAAEHPARAGSSAEKDVRHDRELIREYFPEFGQLDTVVWQGKVLGAKRSAVPGPSDVRLSGVAKLTSADAERLRGAYAWEKKADTPEVLPSIRPYVPGSSRWQVSKDFTLSVTEGVYLGSFYVDFQQRVVVFDARNPRKDAA